MLMFVCPHEWSVSSAYDPRVNMPAPDVEPLFSAVTPILFPDHDGHATGFYFVDDNDDDYLITNYHVVSSGENVPASETIRVLTRPSRNITEFQFHDIPLKNGGDPAWCEHSRGSKVDLVAIPISFDTEPTETVALHSGLFPDQGTMPITQSATIIGYPMLEKAPFLPLLRDASIASPYGTTYRDSPCFATDANMHSGTSGSPVFTLPTSTARVGDMLGQELNLIGVHSATLFSGHAPEEGALDLNIGWYIQLLADIVEIN